VARGMYGLRTKIRKENTGRLDDSAYRRLALDECRTVVVKIETVYATMQPPLPPPAASTGADEAGSASGVVEVMVKSSVKKSIGVIVW
jgi:hypothetical protein